MNSDYRFFTFAKGHGTTIATSKQYMSKYNHIVGALAAAILVPSSLLGTTVTATWDDLPNGSYAPTPLGYKGYNWYFGDSTFGSLGPNDGFHGQLQYSTDVNSYSAPNAAYNAWGNTPMRIESLTPGAGDEFTMSAWFSGVGFPGFGSAAYEIEAQGFVGTSSTPAFTTIFTLPSDGSWINESFTGVDVNKMLFSPLDINGNPSAYLSGYFWMDNATLTSVSAVPDSGNWSITGLAAGAIFGMFALIRRRHAS